MWWRIQRAVLGFFSDQNSPPYGLQPPQAPPLVQPQPIAIPGYGVFLPHPQGASNAPIPQFPAIGSTSSGLAAPATAPQHIVAPVAIYRSENTPTATGIQLAYAPSHVSLTGTQRRHVHKPLPPTPIESAAVNEDPEDDQYTSDVHQELQRHSKSDEISISYVSILFELVVLRQYLTLDPSHDAEIYELSRILGDDDYNWSSTNDFALRGRIQRNFTIHEKAFQSTVNNVAGKLQPVAGSSTENASSWLTELHLNKQLDRAGVVELKNPLDLIRVLQEDGSSYIFGTVNHEFKDDMSLTGSINPTSTQQEELSFTPHSPQPFPLAQLPIDDNPNFANPTKSSITTSNPAKPPPQPFRVIQPAPANHTRTQSKPLRQTQLSFPVALKPTSNVIDPASQAPKRQLRQVTMNQRKAADPDSRPMKRRKKV
ncbi:hypothetical protein EST38_g13467 [Candolleomyces aberdarensis]|uniref:Uncharacterized protein n=1 Tax=Candolleomyces aberdarensis TaxID=2316362 RepID=A0A4Q2D2K9_9AGAR|nr:hypothetical protein EST38_g13467 [Candolleomyces aberdarensis]